MITTEETINNGYFERKYAETKKDIPVRQRITEQRGKCMTNEIKSL